MREVVYPSKEGGTSNANIPQMQPSRLVIYHNVDNRLSEPFVMAINKLGGQVGGQSIDYRGCFDGAQE